MTYEEYLQNLMGDLNPQGGMMRQAPQAPVANMALQQSVAGMFPADDGAAYVPRQLSDLNAVRAAKQAEIAQRSGAALVEDPNSVQARLAASVSGGGYYTNQGTTGSTIGQGVNQNAAAMGLGMLAASERLGKVSPFTAAVLGLLGGSIADYQIGANSAADAALASIANQGIPGVVSVSDKDGNVYSKSTPETIAAADAAMFSDSSSNGGFSYGTSDYGGYSADTGYTGGGGWSSSDYGGGWSGY